MRALVKSKPEPGLSLMDVEKPEVKEADDVLIEVKACAICVGEVRVYDWDRWAASDPTLVLPTILGHEASGRISGVGSGVDRFEVGDRVVIDPLIYCGHCYQCREGRHNICVNREIYGKRRGAFAEYAIVPERVVCPLPENMSFEGGTLLENFGVAVHAVEQVNHNPGDTVVVIGCGPIGIMAAQVLKAFGVEVVSTEINDHRINIAKKNPLCYRGRR